MNEQLQSLQRVHGSVLEMAVAYGPRVLTALLILVAGAIVGRWVVRWMEPALAKFDLEPPVRGLIARLLRLLVLGLFLMVALQNLGVELLPLIAGLGIAGAGVALGAAGRAWQPGGRLDDHLHAALSCRRVHLDRRRRGADRVDRAVQHHLEPPRPLDRCRGRTARLSARTPDNYGTPQVGLAA